MNRWIAITGSIALGCVLLAGQEAAPRQDAPGIETRFTSVDVLLDSGSTPLAAYQLTFVASNAQAKIVGVEGGEHPAFKEAPFYDPKAIQQERVVIAAFNTAPAGKLPSGRTRVATIHLQVSGREALKPQVQLQVAAGPDGQPISCNAVCIPRKDQ